MISSTVVRFSLVFILINACLDKQLASYARIIRRTKNDHDTISTINSNVELSCELTYYYRSDVVWRKREGRMSDDSEEYGGKLIIRNLKIEDMGEYECYLPNGQVSDKVRLTVLNEEPNLSKRVHFDRDIDENVELTCQLSDHKENSKLKWRKINGKLSEYSRDYGNKLLIYFLKEQDSGYYECFLPNGRSSRVTLNVGNSFEKNNNLEQEDPHQTKHENEHTEQEPISHYRQLEEKLNFEYNVEKDVDSNVELSCGLNDDEENELKWRKINGKLSDYARSYQNTLQIYYLKEEDSGEYECYLPDGRTHQVRLTVLRNANEIVKSNENQFLELTQYLNQNEKTPRSQIEYEPYFEREVAQSVSIRCGLTGDGVNELKWKKIEPREIDLSENSEVFENRLVINDLKVEDSGDYECYLPDGRTNLVRLLVRDTRIQPNDNEENQRRQNEEENEARRRDQEEEDIRRRQQAERDRQNQNRQVILICNIDQATCRNGQCISRSGLCDGKNDCDDGSDENNCGGYTSANNCQPNEKACRNGKCKQKIWFCDGEKDCEDGSDEESCLPAKPGEMCKTTEFQCRNRNQCILKSFQCDKEFDCVDQSDEIGCEIPRITQNPIRNLTTCLGSTFRIECHAVGFPVPFINWRLNWGHTCEEPRCFSTNDNGKGIFTVTDARYTDQGAYSCEAINSQGRVFAVPDTIVTVDSCIAPFIQITDPPSDDCFCNNHSVECTCSGICIRCEHNTYGDKCQYCKEGFIGDATRGTPFDCLPIGYVRTTTPEPEPLIQNDCFCNNHSIDCTCSGYCLRCEHNTYGDKCQYCLPGFIGDATRGTPYDCTTGIPTTTIAPEPLIANDCFCNNHSLECTCSGVCIKCEHNTKGKQCEMCLDDFIGDATKGTPFDCLPAFTPSNLEMPSESNKCNTHGTARVIGNTCKCKYGVVGRLCDKCAERSFNLITHRYYKKGCLSCFCNGLTVGCFSSDLYYNKLEADFTNESNQWKISDKFTRTTEDVELVEKAIQFNKFEDLKENFRDLYFIVPEKFKNNKIKSYGGNLTFTIKFSQTDNLNNEQEAKNVEIRISGSQINIYHSVKNPIKANVENEILISLYEDEFKRYGDDGKVDRDHLMMALSNINLFMIRASYTKEQTSVELSKFSLDHADQDSTFSDVSALSVEQCDCPDGYSGTSCESCAPGFQRSNRGFYLGLCGLAN